MEAPLCYGSGKLDLKGADQIFRLRAPGGEQLPMGA
jgi:hypothetical protein